METTEATAARFFIVNQFDRPCARCIAEKRSNGLFYYIHPELRDIKAHHGMNPTAPTSLHALGLRVEIKGHRFIAHLDPSLTATATYEDGRPRKWQGDSQFSFTLA